MFFLPEYDILYTAAKNLLRTIPVEGKVHSSQGRTRCPPAKARYTPNWQFSVLSRRPRYWPLHSGGMFSFFHKTRIIYGQHTEDLPNLFWKLFLVNIQKGLFLKRGSWKKLLHGTDILLPGKMECNRLRSNGLNSPVINVRNSFLCGSERKQGKEFWKYFSSSVWSKILFSSLEYQFS